MTRIEHFNAASAIGENTPVIKNLAFQKQIDAENELSGLRMAHHGNIEQSVIGHGIGSLPVALTIANAHRHHLSFYRLAVDSHIHLVFQPLEAHEDKREDE